MTTKTLRYGSELLYQLNLRSGLKENFSLFHLETDTRVNIISFRMRKHFKPYRRSRAGRRTIPLTIVSQHIIKARSTKCNAISLDNLTCIPKCACDKEQCSQSSLNCALLNCRSNVNKTQDLHIELKQNKVDICALTETWIQSDDTITIYSMCPQGHTTISVPRKDKQVGGIALVHCNTCKVKLHSIYDYPTMECADFELIESSSKTRLAVIY